MADRDRWYEVTAYFDKKAEKVVEEAGQRMVMKGSIDDLVIVQVPSGVPQRVAHRLMMQTQETLRLGGVNKPMILIPDNVKLMRLRKMSREEMEKVQEIAAATGANDSTPPKGKMH